MVSNVNVEMPEACKPSVSVIGTGFWFKCYGIYGQNWALSIISGKISAQLLIQYFNHR
ncbi:hypothetical protein BDD43_3144 [Mucilaginibacter gracilis]|uniref:Uncharacterized protein n=1 Tax=Mucilaginibacter gracilis TaxID=423350 RepID=A0A495J1U0_9SPHI|nr:hypothetical protein BDD43_3144 [Mucilaginibacter gracilis]